MERTALDIASLSPWLTVHTSRSPGPGGQNVNKVNTRVTLLFDIDRCVHFNDAQKARIRRKLRTRLSRDGMIRVVSSRYRTQSRNRTAAGERLIELLTEALRRRKARRPTRPTAASRQKRLAAKQQRSETKSRRRPVTEE
jgi:ribosome-associated protein